MSLVTRATVWKVVVYRSDSHTPVVYENVKHAWWEDGRYVISQYSDETLTAHHYWTWPESRISHVKEERGYVKGESP